MNKIKVIICLMLFMFCLNVKALDSCSTDELNGLKELANNVEIIKNLEIDDSRYNPEDKSSGVGVYYTIKISNVNDDLMIFINNDGEKVKIDLNEVENFIFDNGSTSTFYIYSYTDNSCTNEFLRTITVKFDEYNPYYFINKDRCSKYSDFKYCKEYMKIGNKSYEELDKLFDEYIKENTQNNNKNYTEYLYYIIGGIVLVVLIILIVSYAVRRHKKNRL